MAVELHLLLVLLVVPLLRVLGLPTKVVLAVLPVLLDLETAAVVAVLLLLMDQQDLLVVGQALLLVMAAEEVRELLGMVRQVRPLLVVMVVLALGPVSVVEEPVPLVILDQMVVEEEAVVEELRTLRQLMPVE